MNINKLIKSILIPVLVGLLSSFLTSDSMASFALLQKPPLSPPAWLFPVVWTILYILMGVSSYLVNTSDAPPAKIKKANSVYIMSLVFNFFWSIIFFNMEQYLFAFVWLLMLLLLVVYTVVLYHNISKTAAYLQIPYIIWLLFAAYLNFGIFILN